MLVYNDLVAEAPGDQPLTLGRRLTLQRLLQHAQRAALSTWPGLPDVIPLVPSMLQPDSHAQRPFFLVGYKGSKIYWLAIHSNQANLIVGGLRHRRHQQTRQAPLSRRRPATIAVQPNLQSS
jgi:hypothetical protein